jgi:hypothetical protein
MTPWKIHQLEDRMKEDLEACHTQHERIMVKAISGMEIRKCAERWAKQRKLTPGEVAIASKYGYRP